MTWSAVDEVQFVDLAAALTLTGVLALSDPATHSAPVELTRMMLIPQSSVQGV